MGFICNVISDTSFWGNIVGSFIGVIGAVYILKKQTKESIILEKEMFIRKDRILKLEEAILFCNEFESQIIEILKIIKEQQNVKEEEYKKILAIYLEMNKSFDRFIIQEDLFMEFDEMDNEFFRKFETDNIFKEFDEKYKNLGENISNCKKVCSIPSEQIEAEFTVMDITLNNIEININNANNEIKEFKKILDKYRTILFYFKKFNLFMLRKKVEEKDSKEFLDKIKKEYDSKNKKYKS